MKSEVILYTGLSALQKKCYKAILTKDIGEAYVIHIIALPTFFSYIVH